jgi:hypothetical protein
MELRAGRMPECSPGCVCSQPILHGRGDTAYAQARDGTTLSWNHNLSQSTCMDMGDDSKISPDFGLHVVQACISLLYAEVSLMRVSRTENRLDTWADTKSAPPMHAPGQPATW